MKESKLGVNETDELYLAVLSLKTEEECKRFFTDLCTIQELKAMAQRLEVARLLDRGVTYNDISVKTGASTATISRVNRSLVHGGGGYKIVFQSTKSEE